MNPIVLERPMAVRLAALPPLALYVHIPWCVRKCPYCDFNSHERGGAALPEERYVDKLLTDLEALLPSVWGRRVTSVFIGGGTPSLFSAASIDRLLSGVRARVQLEPGCEVTLEANPGTVEAERFAGFAGAGINRISVGVQSFDEGMLQKLGRIHSGAEARRAIDAALKAIGNVNADLMYGLPGQDLAQAGADVEAALASGVPHVSAYQLTIEPNTAFWSRPPVLPIDDEVADMQRMVEESLSQAGFQHYETSAFARPGHRCRHNLNYWEFGDYLGIGAGAHGKLSFPDRVTRHERIKQPAEYLQRASTLAGEKVVPATELPFEFMLNALRLVDGFPVALFQERTGLPFSSIQADVDKAEADGLLARNLVHIRPTERGRLFLNDLLQRFIAGERTGPR
jgi:putative oxygen-independent coproporphyrinogen III oxidase